MAFPTVASRHTTGITTASASHAVNLSASSVAGNLYIGIARLAGAPTSVNFPAGWNMLKSLDQTGTTVDKLRVFYKLLAPGDAEIGAATMTVTTTGGSAKAAYHILRLTVGTFDTGTAPEISADATGTSTTPNPNSLAPSWGADDTLWIWAGGWEGEQTTPPAANPTNYANIAGIGSGTGGAVETNCRVATADRSLNAASEDPGSVTISASDDWIAWTIAVKPVSAGGTTYEETGSLTAGTVAAGADVREAVETGALTTSTQPRAADVAEHSRTASLTTVAQPRAADVHENVEAGSLTTRALASGVQVYIPAGPVTHEETGALTAGTVAAGVDSHENVEAGALTAGTQARAADVHENVEAGTAPVGTVLSGVAVKVVAGVFAKTGSLTAGTQPRAADVATLNRTGSATAGTQPRGADATTVSRTGALLADTLMAGVAQHVLPAPPIVPADLSIVNGQPVEVETTTLPGAVVSVLDVTGILVTLADQQPVDVSVGTPAGVTVTIMDKEP